MPNLVSKWFRIWGFLCRSGKTTLSASGMLVPDSLIGLPVGDFVAGLGYKGPEISGLVVTAGSLVEPFLPWDVRAGGVESGELVGLINGAQIDVLSEVYIVASFVF